MKPNYSSEFGKTLSSGISALVKGKQQYYILEHLVGSHYHSAGEKQEIMLDFKNKMKNVFLYKKQFLKNFLIHLL